jgi:hypothetical protein
MGSEEALGLAICQHCGTHGPAGDVCMGCGARLASDPIPTAQPWWRRQRSRDIATGIGTILVVLGVLGGADDPAHFYPWGAVLIGLGVSAIAFVVLTRPNPEERRNETWVRIRDALPRLLEGDERLVAGAASGGAVDLEGPVGQVLRQFEEISRMFERTDADPCFVVVTDRRLLVLDPPRSPKTQSVRFACLRAEATVAQVRSGPNAILMSVRPGNRFLVELSFRGPWLKEGEAVRDALLQPVGREPS